MTLKENRAYLVNKVTTVDSETVGKGMAGITRLVAELDSRGIPSAATYLRNAGEEILTVKRLRELKIVPELVMLAPQCSGEVRQVSGGGQA